MQPADSDQPLHYSSEGSGSGSEVLNELLEATLSKRSRPLTAEEWFLWKDASRKQNLKDATLEDFVKMMVESLLTIRFPSMIADVTKLASMSLCIANTLCGDPLSRRRLTDFHAQMRELSSGH